jgi:hypothetical protein
MGRKRTQRGRGPGAQPEPSPADSSGRAPEVRAANAGRAGGLWRHLRANADIYGAAATALAFVAHLFATSAPFGGSQTDIFSLEHPLHAFATSWLSRGTLPLWNPFVFGGVPFQAGVHGYLYPGWWTGLALPPALDIKVGIALHLMLAAAGGAWLARGRTTRLLSSYVGGVVFALSGFMVAHLFAGHRVLVATVAYLPWVAGFLDRFARGQGSRPVAAVGVAGLMLLCGHYQMIYAGMLGVLLFLVVDRLVAAPPDGAWSLAHAARDAGRAAGAWAVVLAGGALVAAVQVLPTLGTLRLSQRASGGEAFAASFASAPANLLTYLLPNLFGNRVDVPAMGDWSYWESLGYLGLAPLALVGCMIALRPWRRWLAAVVVASFGLLLALGAHTPVLRGWVAIAPGAELFRAAGRYCVLATLFGALLAAEGLDAWLDDEVPEGRRRAAFVAVVALSLVGVAALVWTRSLGVAGLRDALGGAAAKLASAPGEQATALLALVRSDGAKAALVLVSFAALLSVGLQQARRRAAALVVAALVVVDLYHFGHRFLGPGAPERLGWPDAIVQALKSNGEPGARVFVTSELRAPNHAAMYGLGTVGGYDIFVDGRYARYVNRANRQPPGRFLAFMTPKSQTRLHRRLGASLLLSSEDLEQGRGRARVGSDALALLATDGPLRAYRDRAAEPRVALAHAVEVVPDEEAVYARLEDPAFDLRRAALLEAPLPAGAAAPAPPPPGSAERAAIVAYTPDRVEIEVEAASAGVVVLSDTLHPGWSARVDGRAAPLVHANRVMRAVPVGPGTHRVVMRYLPTSFVAGAGLSGLAVLALGLAAWRGRRARRGAATPPAAS